MTVSPVTRAALDDLTFASAVPVTPIPAPVVHHGRGRVSAPTPASPASSGAAAAGTSTRRKRPRVSLVSVDESTLHEELRTQPAVKVANICIMVCDGATSPLMEVK